MGRAPRRRSTGDKHKTRSRKRGHTLTLVTEYLQRSPKSWKDEEAIFRKLHDTGHWISRIEFRKILHRAHMDGVLLHSWHSGGWRLWLEKPSYENAKKQVIKYMYHHHPSTVLLHSAYDVHEIFDKRVKAMHAKFVWLVDGMRKEMLIMDDGGAHRLTPIAWAQAALDYGVI